MLLEDISDGKLIESGIVLSQNKLTAPLWIDGQNVYFSEQSVWKSKGYATLAYVGEDAPLRGGNSLRVSGTPTAYMGTPSNIYKIVDTTVTTEGTGYSGVANESTTTLASTWIMEPWDEWMVATNGVDNLQIDKGSGFGALAGSPPTKARVILRFGVFMLAFNTDQGDRIGEWCDTGNVEQWASGAAGNLPFRELNGEIVAAAKIGRQIAVYSATNAVILEYKGSPVWFGVRPGSIEGISTAGAAAVVERDKLNYGMGREGVWVFDGSVVKKLDTPEIRRWLDDNVNWEQKSKICGYLNEVRNQVEWSIPTGISLEPNKTLIYNYQNNSFSFRSYAWTTLLQRKHFDEPLGGDSTGTTHLLETGLDAGSEALVSYIQSKPLYAKDPDATKFVDILKVIVRDLAGSGVKVQLGTQDNIDDDITWTDLKAIDDGREPITFRPPEAQYITFKLYSDGLGDNFTLSGFSLHGAYTGKRMI